VADFFAFSVNDVDCSALKQCCWLQTCWCAMPVMVHCIYLTLLHMHTWYNFLFLSSSVKFVKFMTWINS